MTPVQLAQTIINQMGGTGRLSAMIGANNFVTTENGVQFSFKGSRKANRCTVTLDASDTYTMKLYKVNARTFDFSMTAEHEDLYWDMLKPVFERETGLYLSL
jgi:hypothetical protein